MATMDFFDTDYGAKLAYRKTEGRNPGVVFLTGFMSNMEGSKAVHIEEFVTQRGNAFLRFDYRGHGHSSDEFGNGTISDWAQDAVTAVQTLTTGPQVLVGSSMGGWLMLKTALSANHINPDKVAGLVGLASAPDFTRTLHQHYLNDQQRIDIKEKGYIEVACDYDDSPYVITQRLLEDGEHNCLLDSPIPLNVPVRLIHGMMDEDVAWQTSLTLAEQLTSTDVETLMIKNGDHRLSSASDLNRITQCLDQLLSQLERD